MSVQQLQATLREHAAAVSDDALEGRAAASIARARTIRRRQALAVVAAAAVIGPLVGAAILGANPLERSAPPVHKPEKVPTVQAAFAGRELLDSAVVRDKGELTVTRETKVPTQWTVACYGVGSDYTVHATFDGAAAGAAPCEGLEPHEPLLGYVHDRRRNAGNHNMHVWLTREGSAEIVPAHGSVLTAGVYQLPPPVAVVAGADVYEREVAFGPGWQYAASRYSERGDRGVVAAEETGARLL